MYVFISILIVICAVLLVLIVLVQNSKGGGLASGFSSSNQVLGVRKTTDFLEKATWALAGSVVVLCIGLTAFIPRGETVSTSDVLQNISAPAYNDGPDFGVAQPDAQQPGTAVPLQEVPIIPQQTPTE